jgi:DNA-directed RNA polymerase specialized sigma24 family protein
MTADHKFNEIFEAYHPRILQYLTRMVGPEDAEDLSQEVFDKINRGLGAGSREDPSSPPGYIASQPTPSSTDPARLRPNMRNCTLL